MKHLNKFTLMLGLMLAVLAACKKDSGEDVVPVNMTVKVGFANEDAAFGFSLEKATVTATNLVTKQVYTAITSASGEATFNGISPGSYDLATSLSIAADDYNAKAGTNVQEAVVYNATLGGQSIVQDGQIDLVLKTGRIGDFVIKQVYYAGSHVTNGANFRDQFLEIYNNSNETLYADSLYFGQIMGNARAVQSVDQSQGFYLPSGQYDWTKSAGKNNAKANTDYAYAKTLFMIPGTGKQYPVLPGESIIIAATAINHQSPFTDNNGKTISVKDPTLTIDLSKAEFEVYLGDQPGINPYPSDLNAAAVNVTVISNTGGRELILDNLGRDGIVIFKTTEDVKTWDKYAAPDVKQVTATTDLFIQIPVQTITDGLNLQHAVSASRVAKRLPEVVDAGEAFVPGGSYSSQSVVRKVSKTVNGRVILKDTNNSLNDFGYLPKADPSKAASSFIQ